MILLKKLDSLLCDGDVDVLFYDEAFFRRESTVTRGWYVRGLKHHVKCPATREKVGVCGAVNPKDGSLLSLVFDGFNSLTFIVYLTWLLDHCQTDKKIALVLDNASSHTSKKVKDFVHGLENRIVLVFLPPYSPDLNPVERVWKDLRYRITHNTYFDSYSKLENAITRYLRTHATPNEKLKLLCCI